MRVWLPGPRWRAHGQQPGLYMDRQAGDRLALAFHL